MRSFWQGKNHPQDTASLLSFWQTSRSFNTENFGSVGQRTAKLLAVKLWECCIFDTPNNFWILKQMTSANIKNMTFFNFWGQIYVQWQKSIWIDAQYVKIDKKLAISRQYPEFQKISGRFQEWWNFKILCWKSNFLT